MKVDSEGLHWIAEVLAHTLVRVTHLATNAVRLAS
jgi:hypothetical protein